ncbi:MAG: hypothetical protein HYR89_11155, partial [Actinobacteria bacterium]|nr:hypothetical protein [Actinomycetota bacterium]
LPRLSDAIKIDRALLQLACGAKEQTLTLTGDPTELARALEAGHEPPAGRQPTLATLA